MDNVRYSVGGGLTAPQLDRMHAAVLRVLREVGVEVGSPTLLEAASRAPGAHVDGRRVRFEPDLINDLVEERRRAAPEPGPGPDRFAISILSGYAFQLLDESTGELCPMTTADCVRMARLVDGLHGEGVRGGTPGLPQDAPVPLREVLACRISVENCRAPGLVGFTSCAAARIIHRICEVVGQPFELPVFVLSPLRVEGSGIEMALDFMERGVPAPINVYGMPILGLTTPLPLPGAFVEGVAGILAGAALLRCMGFGDEVGYRFDVYPFDMKYGTIAYGTPEHVLAYLLGAQVNRYYGVDGRQCKAFHTNARFPDAHAMAQRSAFAAVAALNGARTFTFGGMLGIDKIFSPEQLLLDVEICRYLELVAAGFAFDADALAVDAIAEVGPGGSFITHPTTLRDYRGLYGSGLFENLSPEQWEARQGPGLREKMQARIAALGDAHEFALDPDAQREIAAIYEDARRELA